MRTNYILGLALAGSALLLTGVARSQMVRTYSDGAVHVRAPFVRVFVGPNGETSVRAPFATIDTPGRRHISYGGTRANDLYGAQSGKLQSQPTLADPAALDWQALRRMLRSGATRLEKQLDQTARGKGWKEYLQTDLLCELVAGDVNRPPDSDAIEALRDTLRLYDATSASRRFRMITSLAGFAMVQSALRELVIPPLHRARRQLAHSARDLQRALMRLDTGSQWMHYLQLPNEVFIGALSAAPQTPLPPDTEPTSEHGLRQLDDTLARFETVVHNPAHIAISELTSFKKTHDRLTTYVGLLRKALSEHPSGDRQIEVLPTPQPKPL
jgi:hypothetical protein